MRTEDRIYLDHNAGAPLRPDAREVMTRLLPMSGNASSVHLEGREARRHVENARRVLADELGCEPRQIVFTSGASEAAAHVLCPLLRNRGQQVRLSRLYVSAIEHPAVLSGGRFPADKVVHLPVTGDGVVDLAEMEYILARHDADAGPPLVALMLANNETGVVQPVAAASEIVRRYEGYLVVDAVQGLGKLDLVLAGLCADFALLSSHKIGGPQGIGAVVMADPLISPAPLVAGGGQEGFHRAGTENVAAIAGFGAAIADVGGGKNRFAGSRIRELRDFIESGLYTICREWFGNAVEPVIFGEGTDRLDNTSCFAIPGLSAETALISLDLEGIALSSGSACSSGKVRRSHVLTAMGIADDLAAGALRVSLGSDNDRKDARRFLEAMNDIAGQIARVNRRVAV